MCAVELTWVVYEMPPQPPPPDIHNHDSPLTHYSQGECFFYGSYSQCHKM